MCCPTTPSPPRPNIYISFHETQCIKSVNFLTAVVQMDTFTTKNYKICEDQKVLWESFQDGLTSNSLRIVLVIVIHVKTWPSTSSVGVRQTSVFYIGTKRTLFSRIHSLIVPDLKLAIFAMETPSGWGTSHFKFDLNPLSHH